MPSDMQWVPSELDMLRNWVECWVEEYAELLSNDGTWVNLVTKGRWSLADSTQNQHKDQVNLVYEGTKWA